VAPLEDDKLPEEFAPTGPKLTRFPIQPAPPIRPRLFPDEARFALRLSTMAFAAELAAWVWLATLSWPRALVFVGALRLLKPLWAWLGTRVPRPLVAGLLVVAALAGGVSALRLGPEFLGWAALAFALPAVADLCASCIADSITVERRAAAYAWLDMGQALGGALGFSIGAAFGGAAVLLVAPVTAVALIGLRDLRDRGTPRSSWPLSSYIDAARSSLGTRVGVCALCCGLFVEPAVKATVPSLFWLPLAGMVVAARVERLLPNAVWLPQLATLAVLAGSFAGVPLLMSFGIGAMFAAIPAAVARGAGEMERPLVSSVAWSALTAGAALGTVLRF
jgi:hypothetical protein